MNSAPRSVRIVIGWVIAIAGAPYAHAAIDDWAQWRGPNRDGISSETGLLKEWPKDGPALIWQKKDLGGGYSTPAIVGDRIYLITNKGLTDEFVKSLDVKD